MVDFLNGDGMYKRHIKTLRIITIFQKYVTMRYMKFLRTNNNRIISLINPVIEGIPPHTINLRSTD